MASGRPDWYSSVAMHGKHLNDYITVAVDADGNMLGIMQGEGPGGLDTIALDAGGRLITVLRDPVNDRYLSIDGDGNIVSVIKGDFGGVLKTVAVDVAGNMKANLVVQDLPTQKVRPRYGDIHHKVLTRNHPGIEDWDATFGIVGAGYVLGGYLRHYAGVSQKTCYVEIIVDGVSYPTLTFSGLNDYSLDSYDKNPLYLLKYDDATFEYVIGFPYIWTFESTFELTVHEVVGAGGTRGGFFYSIFK